MSEVSAAACGANAQAAGRRGGTAQRDAGTESGGTGRINIATTLGGVCGLLQQVAHPNVKAALDVCNANASYETAGDWFRSAGQ